MVSELKDQNGLLKKEKDDLNRRIQEQGQQMTGTSLPPAAPILRHQEKERETLWSINNRMFCLKLVFVSSLLEKMTRAIAQETQQLETDLNEERSRYQNLLTEHLRLEEKYEDLKEEFAHSSVRSTDWRETQIPASLLLMGFLLIS